MHYLQTKHLWNVLFTNSMQINLSLFQYMHASNLEISKSFTMSSSRQIFFNILLLVLSPAEKELEMVQKTEVNGRVELVNFLFLFPYNISTQFQRLLLTEILRIKNKGEPLVSLLIFFIKLVILVLELSKKVFVAVEIHLKNFSRWISPAT